MWNNICRKQSGYIDVRNLLHHVSYNDRNHAANMTKY